MTGDIDRRIRERAYEIWESEGRPEGRSEEHWKQARAELNEVSAEAGQDAKARDAAVQDKGSKPKRRRSASEGASQKASSAPSKEGRETTKRSSTGKAARPRRKSSDS